MWVKLILKLIIVLLHVPVDLRPQTQGIESEYLRMYWIPLSHTIQAFLHPSSQNHPISFQETFTMVYKCVGEGYADRLHIDLMQTVVTYLKDLHVKLLQCLTSDNEGRKVRFSFD